MLDVLWFEKEAPKMKWNRFFGGHFLEFVSGKLVEI